MSSYLYGQLTRRRLAAEPSQPLRVGPRRRRVDDLLIGRDVTSYVRALPVEHREWMGSEPNNDVQVLAFDDPLHSGEATGDGQAAAVSKWLDVVAALVPAEVLALHALAVSFFVKIDDSIKPPTVSLEQTGAMTWFFFIFMALAALLTLWGSGFKSLSNWCRAALVALAFVAWSMLQSATMFDGLLAHFQWDVSVGVRTVSAAIAAVVIGALVGTLAGSADQKPRS